jgi:hypothetical protein
LGQALAIRSLEITWPASRQVQVFADVAMDQILLIREGDPQPLSLELKAFKIPALDGAEQQTHEHHSQN